MDTQESGFAVWTSGSSDDEDIFYVNVSGNMNGMQIRYTSEAISKGDIKFKSQMIDCAQCVTEQAVYNLVAFLRPELLTKIGNVVRHAITSYKQGCG